MLENIFIATVAGVVPTLIWLMFWLQEDRKHPEPHRLLFYTFAAGMFVVLPALLLESLVITLVPNTNLHPFLFFLSDTTAPFLRWLSVSFAVSGMAVRIFLWAVIEESAKLLAAAAIVLWRKEVDEPLDYPVYLITTALGFAALENTLFIFNPVASRLITESIAVGDMRFFGATLLHIVTAATIGIAMGLAFYKGRTLKRQYLAGGLILAIALHAAFNLTIINSGGQSSLFVASLVWVIILCILLLLEKIKKIHPVKDYT